MTQALYAHMNNKIIKKKEKISEVKKKKNARSLPKHLLQK
jgi:hypothetical protein